MVGNGCGAHDVKQTGAEDGEPLSPADSKAVRDTRAAVVADKNDGDSGWGTAGCSSDFSLKGCHERSADGELVVFLNGAAGAVAWKIRRKDWGIWREKGYQVTPPDISVSASLGESLVDGTNLHIGGLRVSMD